MIAKSVNTIINPIHNGDNTHSHDQVITPVSFNPINNTVRSPVKPIPPELEDDEAINFMFNN